MHTSSDSVNGHPGAKSTPIELADLPPVEPPTAGFIVQLFVIPAVIVAVVIVVWLLFGKLAGGERDAASYVDTLRSRDANYRAAFELVSLIQNDSKLASDPVLLGELVQLLEDDLKARADKKLLQYLTLTIGTFQTLEARLRSGRAADTLGALRGALSSDQASEVRIAAAASLAKHAARMKGELDDFDAVRALADAARTPDEPELRKIAAFSLGFFGGEESSKALRECMSDSDRDVRYNVAVALARRDDPAAFDQLADMLDESSLRRAEAAIPESERANKSELILLQSLEALQAAAASGKSALSERLAPRIAKLENSELVAVRSKARELLRTIAPVEAKK